MTLIPELRAELAATLERRARRRRRWLFGLPPVALVATGRDRAGRERRA